MAQAIPKFEESEIEEVKQSIRATIVDLDDRSAFERFQIEQCIDDVAYWVVVTDTLKRDVLQRGVLANKTKGAKDNKQRTQVERETMSLLHKVQPRMYEAFKRLDKLCIRGDSDKKQEDHSELLSFATNRG